MEIVVCKTGMARHCPDLPARVEGVVTVECFDRCETCERFLLARVDGAMMKLRHADELVETVRALRDG